MAKYLAIYGHVWSFEGVCRNYRHPGPRRVLGGFELTILAQNDYKSGFWHQMSTHEGHRGMKKI